MRILSAVRVPARQILTRALNARRTRAFTPLKNTTSGRQKIYEFLKTKTGNSALNLKRKLSFLDREKEKEIGLETYNEDGQNPIHF